LIRVVARSQADSAGWPLNRYLPAELDHLVWRYAEEFGRREGVAVDGVAVFDALHRRHKAGDAILYGFDLLELDGEDFQPLLLAERKARPARLMAPAKGQDRRERALRRGRPCFGTPARWTWRASSRSG
jgi:hypothetical protein